jgi:phospholipid/cholesterol/gamma-HCH transport system substrate-binding protein
VSANLAVVTAKLSSGEGTIGRLLMHDKMYQDADDLVKELRESVEDAREQAPVTSFIRAALTAF